MSVRLSTSTIEHSSQPRRVGTLGTVWTRALILISVAFGMVGCQSGTNETLILATTTSTRDTGLLDVLVPMFEEQTGSSVKTIAVGTGATLTMGRRGEADVLLVHAPSQEQTFMDEGHGIKRQPFMFNDFVLLGPAEDAAEVSEAKSAAEAFQKISALQALFLSRGDDSGTHFREQLVWEMAGVEPSGAWYQQTGQGMGQTLIIAADKKAYTLSDRGTYLNLKERTELNVLYEGDTELRNIYSVILVNPEKSTKINKELAQTFFDFILSQAVSEVIEALGVEQHGEPYFRLLSNR